MIKFCAGLINTMYNIKTVSIAASHIANECFIVRQCLKECLENNFRLLWPKEI